MLFPVADLAMPQGPPPQGIIDKKWLWHLLIVVLTLCFLLRFVGLDIPGALLSGLMLCFAVIMTRDGMQETLRYALVFAVLCFLNFFFDLLPLMTELGGRVQSKTVPLTSHSESGGARQTEYKMVVTTRPFFDNAEGFLYNVQSFSMVLSPIAMALGCYLAVSAHLEAQRVMPDFFDGDFREEGLVGLLPRTGNAGGNPAQMARNRGAANEPTAPEDRPASSADTNRNQAGANYFQGRAYKLGPGAVGNN